MKLKKNVNINSLITCLGDIQTQAASLTSDFKQAVKLFDDTKLGITELNYNIDEDLIRFRHSFSKIEEIIKGL